MQSASYVVHLVDCDDPHPFKHFTARADAVKYGTSQVQSGAAELANIYEVADTDKPATAIARLQAGKAVQLQTISRQASNSEIDAANRDAFETAKKAGARALLKHLGLIPRDAPDPPPMRRRW
jgi:hypothetical protein